MGLKGRNINKRVLREELLHNWQYRKGGLLSLGRLILEHTVDFVTGGRWDPYYTPGTLEYEG